MKPVKGEMISVKAVQYNKLGEGIFEIFTRLQGGKTYKMASSQEADAKFFYIEDGEIKSGDGITTVKKTEFIVLR